MPEIDEATIHGYLNAAGIPKGELAERVLALVATTIPKHEVIDGAQILELAGVARRTLRYWRDDPDKKFPEPFLTVSNSMALWDAREVRAWLEEHR